MLTERVWGGRPEVPHVKTAVPRLSRRYLPRPRLLTRLDAAADGQLVLLSAPAGHGKTMLLADWAAQDPAHVAWVSLDEDDNDDRRFWAAVLSALGACHAVPDGSVVRELAIPARPSHDGAFLATVINALDDVPGSVRLVLDDVQELTAADPLHGLAALVRHRPGGLRLVLAGRTDPPLSLARMRLAGELSELRARDLRFSVPEADAMLADAGVRLRPDQVGLLVEQTDGWPAGLRLAAMSLRDVADLDGFLAAFAGNDRAVSEYLVGEILERLPVAVCDLLRAVSVSDLLPTELAATLAGRRDAADLLDELERQTSLVTSVGEGRAWYRVHPLLRAHLRADLHRRHPERVAQLHGRAVDFYLGQRRPVPALGHAKEARDRERVTALLVGHAVSLVATGEHAAVRRALRWLGPSAGAAPGVALVAALLAVEDGDLGGAQGHLARAEGAWPSDPGPTVAAMRSLVRSRLTGLLGGPDASRRIGAELGMLAAHDYEPGFAAVAQLDLAAALLEHGDHQQARVLGEAAPASARERGQGYLVARGLGVLAAVAGAEGDHRRMSELVEDADAALPSAQWAGTAGAAYTAVMRAFAALLRAEPAACLEFVTPAVAFVDRPDGNPPVGFGPFVHAVRGAALFDLGRQDAGLADLQRAHALAVRRPASAAPAAAVAFLVHGAAAHAGHHQLAPYGARLGRGRAGGHRRAAGPARPPAAAARSARGGG